MFTNTQQHNSTTSQSKRGNYHWRPDIERERERDQSGVVMTNGNGHKNGHEKGQLPATQATARGQALVSGNGRLSVACALIPHPGK